MAARAVPALAAMLIAQLLRTGVASSITLGGRLRGPLLEAMQFHASGRQSPGPTSVPVGSSASQAGSGPVGGDVADASRPSSQAPAQTQAQTPAPRFDEGVLPQDLQAHSARAEDTLVDAVELAQVSEMKRVVFRALSKLRAAQIQEFDAIAKLQTGAIDDFNDHLNFRTRYGVNYTDSEEDEEGELPVFLPGEEPWWSAPGGPDWTKDLDNTTADEHRGKPARGKPGRTADGEPCICYPELLQVAAPDTDAPAGSALAEIRSCCADLNSVQMTTLGL